MVDKVTSWLAAHAYSPADIDLGLERVEAVRHQLELSLPMPLITVAGTNGKGSVCTFLHAMLSAAGFVVGCYTSPHLLRFSERIRLGNQLATDEQIVEALQRVEKARQKTAVTLTYFELTTLAAALLFTDQRCDIVILEVGLGGRLDAVNVFSPTLSIITNIAIDHSDYLGTTRDLIAREKAGVCRQQKPVIIGDADPPAALLAAVEEKSAHPIRINHDFHVELSTQPCWHYYGRRQPLKNLPMPTATGAHQLTNAACALAALESLPIDFWPGIGAVRIGLQTAEMVGRTQVLPGCPTTILDVAHNPGAALILERFLFDMGYYPFTRAVLGMLARKDVKAFVHALSPRIDAWYIACPSGGDLSAAEIADAAGQVVQSISIFPSIQAATQQARDDSQESDRIVITGSFLTIADFLENGQL